MSQPLRAAVAAHTHTDTQTPCVSRNRPDAADVSRRFVHRRRRSVSGFHAPDKTYFVATSGGPNYYFRRYTSFLEFARRRAIRARHSSTDIVRRQRSTTDCSSIRHYNDLSPLAISVGGVAVAADGQRTAGETGRAVYNLLLARTRNPSSLRGDRSRPKLLDGAV